VAIQLGIIPSWQFDPNPAHNPMLNPHLVMPAGMDQLTVQPTGGYPTNNGLGITMAAYLPPAAAGAGISGPFDSSWWKNRKWLAVGVVSLLGIGTAVFAAKVLR
jgi:hypothetical protein